MANQPPAEPTLIKLDFRPGINQELTRYAGEGGWYDCDMVRFRAGKPEKIGGWVNVQGTGFPGTATGVARAMMNWQSNDGVKWTAIGTHSMLEVWQAGTFYDITPVRVSLSSSNIFTTSIGSTQVLVSLTNHGANDGDYVVFTSVSATVGGNIFPVSTYQVSLVDGNSFTFDSGVTAAATSAAAGGTVLGLFELAAGKQSNVAGAAEGGGWGVSTWGTSTWGTSHGAGIYTPLRTWSLDNWGDDLLANPRGGSIYYWSENGGTGKRAYAVTNAPSRADFLLVSQEDRHAIAFGCPTVDTSVYNPLYMRWCAQEDINDWAASVANDAGDKLLSGASRIVAVKRSRGQILIWTDDPLYGMQNSGPPFTFSFQNLGQGSGLVGPNAVIEAGGNTYWMADQKFMIYDGSGPHPIACSVLRRVFDHLDTTQLEKIFAASNEEFNEIIWFYQSLDSTTGDIDKCVTYNYLENTWSVGTLVRTAWADRNIYTNPVAIDLSGTMYYQEEGFNADGQIVSSFVESNLFDLGDGQEILFLDRIIPDTENRSGDDLDGNLQVYVKYQQYPGSPLQVKGPYTVSARTTKIDLRVRARQACLRIESAGLGQSWRLGTWRFRVAPDGER